MQHRNAITGCSGKCYEVAVCLLLSSVANQLPAENQNSVRNQAVGAHQARSLPGSILRLLLAVPLSSLAKTNRSASYANKSRRLRLGILRRIQLARGSYSVP